MSESLTFTLVGCGSAKRDRALEEGKLRVKRWPAKDLYTSTYFAKKRAYAEEIEGKWGILSAEHAVLAPGQRVAPYDTSITDLTVEEINELAQQINSRLIEWFRFENLPVEEIEVLAGKKYLDPLRERDTFSSISVEVSYPFQENDLGGIGEQMAWLDDRISARDPVEVDA